MISTLSVVLAIIFIALGFVHFHWIFGGTWGLDKALPTKENGERVLNPKKMDSAVVGLGLTTFGLFYALRTELVHIDLPTWITTYAGWLIPSIFILRAMGDFKYIGFFKKIKNTAFAKADSKIFSPLCLALALIGILIQLAMK